MNVWHQADTLKERICNRKPHPHPASLQQWRKAAGLGREEVFQPWLQAQGWTVSDLDDKITAPPSTTRPEWSSGFEAWVHSADWQDVAESCQNLGVEPDSHPLFGFFRVFVQVFLHKQGAPATREETLILRGALGHLMGLLSECTLRVTIAELHLARQQHRLAGDTPEMRFQSFQESWRNAEELLAIYGRYPVLARRLLQMVEAFSNFVHGHRQHWHQDHPKVTHQLLQNPQAPLSAVTFGGNDLHRGGQCNITCQFGEEQVIYKPRSLEPEHFYNRILGLVFPEDAALRSPTVLLGEGYGWQAYLPHQRAEGQTAARHFYRSIGKHLALVHVLGITDLHHENIGVRSDGTPVLYDLETLFTNLDMVREDSPYFSKAQLELRGWLTESIANSGLLPLQTGPLQFVHGLTGLEQMQSLSSREKLVNAGRDDMHIVRVTEEVTLEPRVPLVDGQPATALDHLEDIEQGYREATARLLGQQEQLARLLQQDPLFATRQVMRPTNIYALFINESFHPRHLMDGRMLDAHFARLAQSHLVSPHLTPLVPSEQSDLYLGDVPTFSADPRKTDLHHPQATHGGFYASSALDQALRRLKDPQMDLQVRILSAALGRPPVLNKTPGATLGDHVQHLLRLLEDHAHVGQDGTVSWLEALSPERQGLPLMPIGHDLYSGTAGVLYGVATHQDAFSGATSLVSPLVRTIQHALRHSDHAREMGMGLFSGHLGLMHALARVAHHVPEEDLLAFVVQQVLRNPPEAWCNGKWDVVDGEAGILLGLMALHQQTLEPALMPHIQLLAHVLCSSAETVGEGQVAWRTTRLQKHLCGFGHGASGVGHALAVHGHRYGCKGSLEVARSAFAFETHLFDREVQNWPDLRTDPPEHATSWCNGAAGILLAHALHPDLLCGLQKEQLQQVQHKLTLHRGDTSHAICHGSLGTLDVLLTLEGAGLPDGLLALQNTLEDHQWRSGWSHDPAHVGLMVGLSGHLYALSRFQHLRNTGTLLPGILEVVR